MIMMSSNSPPKIASRPKICKSAMACLTAGSQTRGRGFRRMQGDEVAILHPQGKNFVLQTDSDCRSCDSAVVVTQSYEHVKDEESSYNLSTGSDSVISSLQSDSGFCDGKRIPFYMLQQMDMVDRLNHINISGIQASEHVQQSDAAHNILSINNTCMSSESGYSSQEQSSIDTVDSRSSEGNYRDTADSNLYPIQEHTYCPQILHENSERTVKVNNSATFKRSHLALVSKLYSQDQDGDTHLSIEIILGNIGMSLRIINMALDQSHVNQANKLQQTPLMLAVLSNMAAVVRRLVIGGARLDAVDMDGNTALHLACKFGYLRCAKSLVQTVNSFDTRYNNYTVGFQLIPQKMDIANCDGETCFHLVARHYLDYGLFDSLEIMQILVKNGADLNAQERKSGKTALHFGADNGNKNLLSYLISLPNVDLEARTYSGHTSVQLAHGRGHMFIVTQLQRYGANMKVLDESDSDEMYESDSDDMVIDSLDS